MESDTIALIRLRCDPINVRLLWRPKASCCGSRRRGWQNTRCTGRLMPAGRAARSMEDNGGARLRGGLSPPTDGREAGQIWQGGI